MSAPNASHPVNLPHNLRLVVISGMSGAGKSVALHALEDAGYYCVDNLPPALLLPLLQDMGENLPSLRMAISMDARSSAEALAAIPAQMDLLRERGVEVIPLFLDASNEIIMPYRYWLIEGQVSEIDYDIVPGRRMSLRTARTGQMLYPAGFFDLAFEDVQQYDIDGVTVTQRQNAGRITGISWTREGYEYLLYSLQPEMNMIAGLAVEFVTNTRAEAVV